MPNRYYNLATDQPVEAIRLDDGTYQVIAPNLSDQGLILPASKFHGRFSHCEYCECDQQQQCSVEECRSNALNWSVSAYGRNDYFCPEHRVIRDREIQEWRQRLIAEGYRRWVKAVLKATGVEIQFEVDSIIEGGVFAKALVSTLLSDCRTVREGEVFVLLFNDITITECE